MKHNIIKTDNYLLVVDDSEININQYVYCDLGYIEKVMDIIDGWIYHTNTLGKNPIKHYKKIIAHLPLNPPFIYGYTNSPILESVDLLPPIEDEVEKLAKKHLDSLHNNEDIAHPEMYDAYISFELGYNKAKEKYKYTEEDIDKAYWAGMKFVGEDKGSYKEFIQSLQQPKYPIGFECEMYETQVRDINTHELIKGRMKTTTNLQGQTVWIGKYIYE